MTIYVLTENMDKYLVKVTSTKRKSSEDDANVSETIGSYIDLKA